MQTPQENQTQNARHGKPSTDGRKATARRLWEVMVKIYGQQWIAKNGSVPDQLWMTQIGSLTSDQMTNVCNALMRRCSGGNTWPPSLAEFAALVGEISGNLLGLTAVDVMAEYHRWRSESYRYSHATQYPWRHPVLYHICIDLRRIGVERQMTGKELEALAARLLAKFEKGVAEGKQIPPVRQQIAPPRHAAGPTPAELLKAQAEAAKRKNSPGV